MRRLRAKDLALHGIWLFMLALVYCLAAGPALAQAPMPVERPAVRLPSAATTTPRPRASESGGAQPSQADLSATSKAPANHSQTPATDSGAAESKAGRGNVADRPPAIQEVRPEVMYLRDRGGRLVPTPGFTYEDFVELLRIKQGLDRPAAKVPDYNVQQLLIAGSAASQVAHLNVRIDIQVRKPDWVQVPIGLGGVALDGPAAHEGGGDYFLSYSEEQQRYVVWLRGEAGSEHRLTFDVRAPLTITGARHNLALSLPRAATAKLELDVPGGNVVASATPAELIAEVSAGKSSSKLALLGVGGEITLTWSESGKSAATAEPVLESSGQILVEIDGRSVTSDATLSVRSLGAAFDRFRVQLPTGAVLAGGQQPGYTIAPAGGAGSSLVEVKLDRPTTGPVVVNLQSERTFDLTRPETLELAGFQVLEAVAHRQAGQIGVVATGDWQVVWQNRSRVRQIDEPVEELRRSDLLAAFEYVGQPCSLTARVAPRQPRITVDPQYIYSVNAFRTELSARLKCSIRGAKIFSLELDLPGWQVDEIGPAAIVDLDAAVTGEDARTRIPFVQPTIGDVEIMIRAHRSHASNPGDIELQLPVVKDAVVGPATVAIVPDDNVELSTRTDQLVSLSPQRRGATLELPARRQEPLIFRGERAGAKYVAGLTVHAQKIAVQVASEAKIAQAGVAVEQRFVYQVSYEPLTRLSFAVPANIAMEDEVELYVDQERVEWELVGDHSTATSMRIQVELPEPRMGLVEVVGRFRLAVEELRPATTVPIGLGLVMPLDGEFAGNSLSVHCESGYSVQLREGHWQLADRDQPAAGARLRLAAATAASSVPLSILVDERPMTDTTTVDRAWIQTWVSDAVRQERAVFRISTQQPRISLTLPGNVIATEVEALIDAKPVRPTLKNGSTVVVDWPADENAHTLELRYPYLPEPGGMSIGLTTPAFGSSVRFRRIYWQLVLPRDQHLVASSSSLTPEFTWVWERLHWSRSSLLDQEELEDWTNTLREASLPQSANVYLFSMMGQEPALNVWMMRRSTLVFIASAVVLAVVVLALYTSVLRRARSLLVLGAVVCAMALAYPEPAILLSQAALLGVALALVAAVLHGFLPHERKDSDLSRSRVAAGERSTTDAYYRPAPAAGNSSTASRALALEQASSGTQVQ